MKKITLIAVIMLSFTIASAQSGTCNVQVLQKTLESVGCNYYEYHLVWESTGPASLKIVGDCMSVCLDVSPSEEHERVFLFYCDRTPRIVLSRYNTNNCTGISCDPPEAALPLKVGTLFGNKKDDGVVLTWNSFGSYQAGQQFVVERSVDARNFFATAFVQAKENLTVYTATDKSVPFTQKVFYRVNTDGAYSNTIAVSLKKEGASVDFPQGGSTLRFSNLAGTNVTIVNSVSQVVKVFTVNSDAESFELNNLKSGVYFLICRDLSGRQVLSKKIIR